MSTTIEIQQNGSATSVEVALATPGPKGDPGASNYGVFYDLTTQTNPVANAVNTVRMGTTQESDGVSIVSGSRITVADTGVYNIQFSIQVHKTDSGADTVDLWLALNGVDVPYTNTRLTLDGNSAKAVAAWNFMTAIPAGGYAELRWCSPDVDVALHAGNGLTNPVRPGIPSVIVTVQQVR